MSARTREILSVLGILFLMTSCTNPLVDRVNHAVEVAKGPRIALAVGSSVLPSGGTKDFGQVTIGDTAPIIFTVMNSGKSDLILSGGAASVTISGTNKDQFSLSTAPTLTTIPVGQSATFALSFVPTSAGAKTANVAVASNDPSTGSFTFTVTGTGLYSGTVATPTFNPGQGLYNIDISVAISCSTTGATIYYTTDNSDPTTASQTYSSPLAVAKNGTLETIKAIGVKAGMANSGVASATYMINYGAPGIPTISSAVGGSGQVTITWAAATAASSYNLYWVQGTTVTTTTGTKVSNAVSPQVVSGLASGTDYAFIVTAVNSFGESAASPVKPATTLPAAPTISNAVPGGVQVTVSWGAVTGATSYNLYWAQGATVTTTTGTKVSPAVSPQVVSGLANSTQYAFIVTAVNSAGGESAASPMVNATTLAPLATPQFSPGGGSYQSAQNVTISCSTGGATIRYTTDGSAPSETAGVVYSSPVSISSNLTLQAIAYEAGFADSTIAAASYTFVPPAAPMISSAAAGNGQVTVSWEAVTGAISYNLYWAQGTMVTTGTGTKISSAVSPQVVTGLSSGTQYAFIMTAVGCGGESLASPVATATTFSQVAAPIFNPGAGTYASPQSVTISTTTPGASIHYTTDGTTPTQMTGTLYTTPVSITVSQTLKAIAYKSDWVDSSVATATYTLPGSTWTARTLPSSQTWKSVAYGNGVFVAVATGSTAVAYSTDNGVTWTASTMPSSSQWYSVAYGNGTFVTVGSYHAATSPNGITWTERAIPGATWWSVTYGNGVFVAVAYNSTAAATSADGITWTAGTMPSSQPWFSVTYGNGVFVAVDYNSTTAAYSTNNGVTWTASTLPSSQYWTSVTYGNGVFVAVATNNSTAAATSPDGITWTGRTLPSSAGWYSVTYGNGVFVTLGYGSNVAATSPDGITWTARTLPSSANWSSVTYGNGVFVAVGYNSTAAATSP